MPVDLPPRSTAARSAVSRSAVSSCLLAAVLALSAAVGTQAADAPPRDAAAAPAVSEADGLAAWHRVTRVLQHPRCVNCHQDEHPLQGDVQRVHVPPVSRGDVGMGKGTMVCTACHNMSGNNDTSGTPGAAGWMLAPKSMIWQGVSDPALCAQMKDPERNGHHDGPGLIEHLRSELVVWGWKPGGDRPAPPVSYDAFVRDFTTWVDSGMRCPAP